jgi:hypothetical protein
MLSATDSSAPIAYLSASASASASATRTRTRLRLLHDVDFFTTLMTSRRPLHQRAKACDFINIMTYDLHVSGENQVHWRALSHSTSLGCTLPLDGPPTTNKAGPASFGREPDRPLLRSVRQGRRVLSGQRDHGVAQGWQLQAGPAQHGCPVLRPPGDPTAASPSHPLTHSPSHPLTQSPSHPLTHSPTHPLTGSLGATSSTPSQWAPTRPRRACTRATSARRSPRARTTSTAVCRRSRWVRCVRVARMHSFPIHR